MKAKELISVLWQKSHTKSVEAVENEAVTFSHRAKIHETR
jgi:hypothetical protein